MPNQYFENLPNLLYCNTYCKDITKRVVAANTRSNTPYVFHPYELTNDLRSDQLSEFYFDDSDLDWLIYHSNEIIDPYYQWYLSENNFNTYIIEKYGSLEQSQKLIKYYINNWTDDDRELSVSFYNDNLDGQYKKYWRPTFGATGTIVSWMRRKDNTIMNTNRIMQYTISANNGDASFQVGELVDIKNISVPLTTKDDIQYNWFLPTTNLVDEIIIPGSVEAVGEVVGANTTTVTIKNVSGNTSANSTNIKLVVGETSAANISANAVSTVYENISLEEGAYWEPVYFYDFERICNESRKHMILPDLDMVSYIVDDFNTKVNEDTDFITRLPAD